MKHGNKIKYCSSCARDKGCYQLQNPCINCKETGASLKKEKPIKKSDGTWEVINMNLCVPCAVELKLHNPDENRRKSEKRFQKELKSFVEEIKNKEEFIHIDFENRLYTDCLKHGVNCGNKHWSQIDALIQYRGIYWLNENDEHQHPLSDTKKRFTYELSCELNRMTNSCAVIRMQQINNHIVFIRFNPDAYRKDGELINIPKTKRFKKLKQIMETYTPTKPFEILYMYYDLEDGDLQRKSHKDWNHLLDPLVKVIHH